MMKEKCGDALHGSDPGEFIVGRGDSSGLGEAGLRRMCRMFCVVLVARSLLRCIGWLDGRDGREFGTGGLLMPLLPVVTLASPGSRHRPGARLRPSSPAPRGSFGCQACRSGSPPALPSLRHQRAYRSGRRRRVRSCCWLNRQRAMAPWSPLRSTAGTSRPRKLAGRV